MENGGASADADQRKNLPCKITDYAGTLKKLSI